ncbi:MAG: hypothetical protein P4L83_14595 [Nevskia sp.]|nr:hypothetical protein [Nevskia sp.]
MARNTKSTGRYQVYTKPELYEEDRPAGSWVVRAGVALTALGMMAVFRQPLHALLAAVFGG